MGQSFKKNDLWTDHDAIARKRAREDKRRGGDAPKPVKKVAKPQRDVDGEKDWGWQDGRDDR